ncbi:hypothetical protein TVAG_396300 [Trichomonas vaginalis G3]|uniref:Non-specific serine/threonine protein kinase n=1 Tax=Trichomonas vaginalis (strain ATCC PRA-98 / G3) TaxID=412133 RepID=A2ESE0_TRIV3|nr:protein serine/threonine kinase protein [Trichomonas vaginalis G3]EAY04443.1 hypothetical protein TVAG_396300 [Trichomonas vaginalis G3]KAI5502195.1 protein serine/threonine kinase protein [Trichomonas vaginalis G3]|eukprot:XP_001316666.1 hypothetical protein [Trichomonas vaginalis G3]
MKEKNVKHRDLKPDNIIIDGDFIPHIIDWDDSTDRYSLSISTSHGTVPFTAPEIYKTIRKCASDVFSFGGVMFNVITGNYPFEKAFTTEEGLKYFIEFYKENITSKTRDAYKSLKDYEEIQEMDGASKEEIEEQRRIAAEYVKPIIKEMIQGGLRDDEILVDEKFTKDGFNKEIAGLIFECWKGEYKERIKPVDLEKRMEDIAKTYLNDSEYKQYEAYKKKLSSICDKTYEEVKYGTEEMIMKAKECGFYVNDSSLKEIIKTIDPDFNPDESVFQAFIDSITTYD